MTFKRLRIEGDALVVVFDMCSSSDVLQQLLLAGHLSRFDRLLRQIKEFLADYQTAVPFDPYKFTGDGWILLFPHDSDGPAVFALLQSLCRFYRRTFRAGVLPYLEASPALLGLTFGIDCGPVHATTIYGQREYIARALNVACRLQGSIKDKDSNPAYKGLISNSAYNEYFSQVPKSVKVWKARRTLRNINGGADFLCRKIRFIKP